MKALMHIVTICISLLFSILSIQSMEKEDQSLVLPVEKSNENNLLSLIKDEVLIDVISYFHMYANEAHKYDKAKDMFKGLKSELKGFEGQSKKEKQDLLSVCLWLNDNQVEMLKNGIKFFMQLSCLSKEFNDYLTPEKIGSYCKIYGQNKRDLALNDVLTSYKLKYAIKRLPMLILVCAGANVATYKCEVFETAVKNDDTQLVEAIFKYHTYSTEEKKEHFWWKFHDAKTIEMAESIIKNSGLDIGNETACLRYGDVNYLWSMIGSKRSLELMKIYYDKGCCPRKLFMGGPFTMVSNICLLHGFAMNSFTHGMISQQDVDLFLKKAEFVLELIPDMVNHLGSHNKIDKTPLDMAYASLEDLKDRKKRETNSWNGCARYVQEIENKISAYEQLIVLYRNHGALTQSSLKASTGRLRQELEQQK